MVESWVTLFEGVLGLVSRFFVLIQFKNNLMIDFQPNTANVNVNKFKFHWKCRNAHTYFKVNYSNNSIYPLE